MTATAEQTGLLRAIRETPGDDAVRLIYADWLADAGEEESAEFIRVQIELARMGGAEWPDGRPMGWFCKRTGTWTDWHRWGKRCRCELCSLRRREYETSKRHCVWDWCRGIPAISCNIYRRGFVASITLPLDAFMTHAAAIFAAHPVTAVRLADRDANGAGDGPRWWSRANFDDSVETLWWLPRALFDALVYDPHTNTHPCTNRAYPTDADAHAALSRACVKYGRAAAGLPPLEVS